MKYITCCSHLEEVMASLGFRRKNKNEYLRKKDDVIQKLVFLHATHHEPHVKYYSVYLTVEYPEIAKVIKDMGVYAYHGFSMNIGYSFSANRFIEWKISEEETEDHINQIIDEMFEVIRLYAVPYMDKFTTINDFLLGVEGKFIPSSFLCYKELLPILYLLTGNHAKAKSFMRMTIESLTNTQQSKTLMAYTDFVEKYNKYAAQTAVI